MLRPGHRRVPAAACPRRCFPDSVLPTNLLSVSLLGCKGCKLSLEKDNSWLCYQGRQYEVIESQGLYFIRLDKVLGSEQSDTLRGLASMQPSLEDDVALNGEELACAATLDLWHQRLGFEQKAKLKFCFSKDVVAGSGMPTKIEAPGQPHPATKFLRAKAKNNCTHELSQEKPKRKNSPPEIRCSREKRCWDVLA